MRAINLSVPPPCSTDSVVVLESPREEELLLNRNHSYELFLSSGQRTTAVEHGFLESWVGVVSTVHAQESPPMLGEVISGAGTTNTRCDKLARGRFLDKPSIIGSGGGGGGNTITGSHHANSVPTSTDYRSFLAKLILGVGGRMLSSTPFHHQGQSSTNSNYHRPLSTEKTAVNHSRSFFQAKSLMCGEFNNGDSTTVKIGSSFSGSSGEETTIIKENDALVLATRNGTGSPSRKSGIRGQIKSAIRVSIARTSTTNTNSNASLLRPSQQHSTKKRTIRNRVANWKNKSPGAGTFGFSSPISSNNNARKRLGAKNKRVAVAATHNINNNNTPTKNQAPSAVKHLGIFNFDAPTTTTGGTKATIILNNHSHPHLVASSSPPRCNVVVKTVRSESTVEIQFWTDLVAHRKKTYGEQHSLTQTAAIELGSSYQRSGDHDKAAQTLGSILENLPGTEKHSLVAARILEKLGCVLSSAQDSNGTAKTPEAMEYLTQALNIRCELLGALHADTIECLNILAAQYLRLEDFSNAQRAYYEVFVLRQAVFGKDISGLEHPSVAVAAQRLGQVYARLSEREKALEYLQFAEGIYNSLKVPRDNHSLISVQQGLRSLQ